MKRLLTLVGSLLLLTSIASADDKAVVDAVKKFLTTDEGQQAVYQAAQSFEIKQQMEGFKQMIEPSFKNRLTIDAGKSFSKGPANAKVTIFEFSDYQCPYCQRGAAMVEEIVKMYPNDVKVVFKNFPLPMHKQAGPAAQAAIAAGKQGKFWEFYEVLFGNQAKIPQPDFFVQTAQTLKLDVEKFKKDMESPETKQMVDDDMKLGQANKIQSTPTFVINGVKVEGALPVPYMKYVIDRLISEKK